MRRQLPSLKAIQYFEAAAEHENFVTAAEEIGVTKGAISQQVKLLEQYIGQELFVRTGRGVRLTDAGQRLHSAVRVSLSTLERATSQLSGPRRRNLLRLTVLPAFASKWLVPRLNEFQELCPGTDIEISADAEMVNFDRSDAQIGIRYSKGKSNGLICVPLGYDSLSPVCSPRYRKAHGLQSLNCLKRCRLLHDTVWQGDWSRWAAHIGADLPNLGEGQYFTLYSMAIDAAKSGLGIAMGHELLIHDDLRSGQLVQPFKQCVRAEEQYYLVRPRDRTNFHYVRIFEKWVLESFAKESHGPS